MRKAEQRVWDTMKRNAPNDVWMERVENVVGEGMPDIWMASDQWHCWVELKAARLPVRPTTRVLGREGLRPSQVNWHLKAAVRGLPVYTLIRDNLQNLYLVSCEHADEINEMPLARLQEVSLAGSWEEIFKVLKQ